MRFHFLQIHLNGMVRKKLQRITGNQTDLLFNYFEIVYVRNTYYHKKNT